MLTPAGKYAACGTLLSVPALVLEGKMDHRAIPLVLLALAAAIPPEVAWSFSPGSGMSPPCVHQTLVFVGTEDGRMISLYAYNGEKRWEVQVGGEASYLSASGEMVVAAFSENLICFEASDGRILWSVSLGSRLVGPPLVENRSMFLALQDGSVVSIDVSGSRLWERNLRERISAGPVLSGSLLVGTWEGNIYILNPSSGEVERTVSLGLLHPVSSGLVVEGGTAYAAAGSTLFAISISSGDVLWSLDFGSAVTSLSLQGGRVYVGVSENVLMIEAGSWRVVWSTKIDSKPLALSSDGGRVVAGTADGRLVCLDSDGRKVWEIRSGVPASPPVLAYGKVFLTTSDGRLVCLGSWGTTGQQDRWKGYLFLVLAILCWCLFLSLEAKVRRGRRPRRRRARGRSRAKAKRA